MLIPPQIRDAVNIVRPGRNHSLGMLMGVPASVSRFPLGNRFRALPAILKIRNALLWTNLGNDGEFFNNSRKVLL